MIISSKLCHTGKGAAQREMERVVGKVINCMVFIRMTRVGTMPESVKSAKLTTIKRTHKTQTNKNNISFLKKTKNVVIKINKSLEGSNRGNFYQNI